MARAVIWPRVSTDASPPVVQPVADAPALAAALGPELSRLVGVRISAAVAGEAPAFPGEVVGCGRIALQAGGAAPALVLGCPDGTAAMLLERMFGARAQDAAAASGAALRALPPASASWVALCQTLCAATVRALERAGLRTVGSPATPPRAIDLPFQAAAGLTALALDADGIPATLLLLPEAPQQPAPERAAPDPVAWRRQARARALELDLPVSLRIAEQRIALGALNALAPGDILPIEPPAQLDLMAAGRRIARVPADRLGAMPRQEDGA